MSAKGKSALTKAYQHVTQCGLGMYVYVCVQICVCTRCGVCVCVCVCGCFCALYMCWLTPPPLPQAYLPVPPQSCSWEVRIREVPLASPVLKPHCGHVAKVTPHLPHLLYGPQDGIRPSLEPQHRPKPHPLW